MEKFKSIVKEYGIYVLVIVVVLIIKTYIASPIVVNGDSMYSTLHDGDVMILNKTAYAFSDIKRFDIVVIKHNGKHIIKRIIGLPGDTIKSEDNVLYINDRSYVEDYLDNGTVTDDFEVDKIKKGYYFVLGDNREVSMDSREIGLISEDDIEGHASITLYPFSRFGIKK